MSGEATPPIRQSKRILRVGGVLLLLLSLIPWLQYRAFLASAPPQAVEVSIRKGTTLDQAAQQLEHAGVIPSAFWFRFMVRLGEEGAIHAGEYRFEAGETPAQALERMRQGKVIPLRVLIPEGANLHDVAQTLAHAGWPDAPTRLSAPDAPGRWGVDAPSLEGWLFPETYFYHRGTTLETLLRAMIDRARAVLDKEWSQRPEGYRMSAYETLILASIVEKETGLAEERPRIAAVFHNRLRKGMRLQSDPTVIYGVPEFDGDITRRHLTTPTPYNTYTRAGLPPTPICNPGQAAIHAVLHPLESRELYFVARGDGGHVFSVTLDEHTRHVRRYQSRRRAQPRDATPAGGEDGA